MQCQRFCTEDCEFHSLLASHGKTKCCVYISLTHIILWSSHKYTVSVHKPKTRRCACKTSLRWTKHNTRAQQLTCLRAFAQVTFTHGAAEARENGISSCRQLVFFKYRYHVKHAQNSMTHSLKHLQHHISFTQANINHFHHVLTCEKQKSAAAIIIHRIRLIVWIASEEGAEVSPLR